MPIAPNRQRQVVSEAAVRAIGLRLLVQRYGKEAVAILLDIARHSRSDLARIAACRELLDRGFGKPPQEVAHKGGIAFEIVNYTAPPPVTLPAEASEPAESRCLPDNRLAEWPLNAPISDRAVS